MRPGTWLQPRHGSREVFEKDFPTIDLGGLDVVCPSCKEIVKLARRSPSGKLAGWCKACNRGVGT